LISDPIVNSHGIKPRFVKWANSCLNLSLQHDEALQYRSLILLLISYVFLLVFLCLFLIFILAPLPDETKWITAAIWVYLVCCFSLAIYFLQVSGAYHTAAHFTLFAMLSLVVMGISVTGGAAVSIVTPIAMFLPVLAVYLFGLRIGSYWVGVIFFSMACLFLLDKLNFPFINIIPPEFQIWVFSTIFVEGLFAIFFLILVYENTYERLQFEQQKEQQRTKHLAIHDQLTGIANRSYFYQTLENTLIRNKKLDGGQQLAFVYIDLVGFKDVNDTYGHSVGDHVLQTLARRIEQGVRDNDLVARHGGDEFVILLNSIKSEAAIVQIANKIDQLISDFVDVNGVRLQVYPSMGIAFFPKHAENVIDLERLADEAMYEAKSNGVSWKVYQGQVSQVKQIAQDGIRKS
jgi:diguanylate cyclase (GGDEF)-like protein